MRKPQVDEPKQSILEPSLMFPKPIEKSHLAWKIGYQALLPIAMLLWLAPLLAVALFSIRPDSDFLIGNYWGWPSSFEMTKNYGMVFGSAMPRYIMNSFLITIPTVIGAVALSCMTGFALGVYKFRGNLLVFFMFIAGNFVPFQILMVPVRDLTLDMNLYNTKTGLVLFHIAFQTGFCTLFMRNFIKALPHELIEAARVEGIAEWRIFWFVVLPLMKPAIAALSVLIFTFIWNDYFWAIVLTQGENAQPVTAGITSFNAQFRAMYHLMSAGSIVAALPPVLMFFLMQKHFIAGLTLGAVK
jgi:multiple sugar transport system permease protein